MRKPAPPPPDPAIEASMSSDLRKAFDEYIAFERRVRPVASGSCAHVCAVCRSPCCKAIYCSESWAAPWLRAATSRPGARRRAGPDEEIEGHLATDGCRLRWGRPPVCYEFACADVQKSLPTDDEKYLFRVISHVVTFAGTDALPGTHLVEVTDLGLLDRARVAALRRRIALAEQVFDAAARLFRARGRGLARDWALVTEHFSPKGYELTRGTAAPARPGLRPLPIVRALAALAFALAIAVGGGACATRRPFDLVTAKSQPAGAAGAGRLAGNEFRDAAIALRFDARSDGIRFAVRNLSADRPLVIAWDRSAYTDPQGQRHAVIGYDHTAAFLLREDPPEPLVVGPGEAWSGRVHPRDRIPAPSGPRFFEEPLLESEECAPGTVVGLDLAIGDGSRTAVHQFCFRVSRRAVSP